MYGELQVTFSINTQIGAAESDPVWTLGEGGRLADAQMPWISAIAALRRGDRLHDWERDWIAQWKARHSSEETRDELDVVALWVKTIAPDLERARVEENVPEGIYHYIHLIETVSEEAVPVPREIFDAEGDGRWALDQETSSWGRIA
jgi:hypothetical protein